MYDSLASDYDRFNNWSGRLSFELPFIEQLLIHLRDEKSQPLKILDVACGTGQHAIELAKQGNHVVGTDLSASMIDMARQNARTAGVEVDFRPLGFGDLFSSLNATDFDAVLCLGNSLPHLTSSEKLSRALADFADCLHPGGMLLIQNRNFDLVMQHKMRWMEPQYFQEGGREWVFERFYDFEDNGLIRFNIVVLKREKGKDWSAEVNSTFLAPQLSAELASAVTASGFGHLQLFGSLKGEPFYPDSSSNLVLFALK